MNELMLIPIAYAIGIPAVLAIRHGERVRKRKEGERLNELENETREKERRGEGVLSAVRSAYKSLRRQRAAGYGPWLSAVLEKCQSGAEVPAAVALLALDRTRDELRGSRFDLSGLDDAIAALLEISAPAWWDRDELAENSR